MVIDIVFLGGSSQVDIWSNDKAVVEEDKSYFENFYNSVSNKLNKQLQIEIRTVGNKKYCYYNYLVYNTILNSEGRPGSFWGMSLRMDEYCKDVKNIYWMLDLIFNKSVQGNLLVSSGEKLKYSFDMFSSASQQLKKITEETIELMQKIFGPNDFVNLKNFVNKASEIHKINLTDFSNNDILKNIEKTGGLILSPYLPSKNEYKIQKEYADKIASLRGQFSKERDDLDNKIASHQSEISDLKNKLENAQSKNHELKNQNSKLESELRKQGKIKKAETIIKNIENPIKELAEIFQSISPSETEQREAKKQENKNSIWNSTKIWWIMGLVFVVCAVFTFLLMRNDNDSKSENTIEPVSAEIVCEDPTATTHNAEDDAETPISSSFANSNKPKIEIEGSPEFLIKNSSHIVEIKNGIQGGEWQIEGATKHEPSNPSNPNNPNQIMIIPTENNVTIKYVVDGLPVDELKLQAK